MTRAKRRYLLALVEGRICRACGHREDYVPGRCWPCYEREHYGPGRWNGRLWRVPPHPIHLT